MKDENVHSEKFREAKPTQGLPAAPIWSLFRLEERTVVMTGSNGFLGNALAVAILESGADVVCMDIHEQPKPEEWDMIQAAASQAGNRASYQQCNVQDEARISAVLADVTQVLRFPIRGLVCCAGGSDNGPAVDFPAGAFRRLLDINVTGTFLVAQAVAREVRRSGVSASMVFVASMSGYVSNKGVETAGYNASKAAVHQLARSLTAEWGSRAGMPLVRVNSLSPGYIRTAATAEALRKPGMETQWVGDNMLYRLSLVDEFRAPVVFMLGNGSSFMTGSDLRMDGGHCSW